MYYWVDIPYDGPQGRSWQTNWGLVSVHSFRAPAGTLERRQSYHWTDGYGSYRHSNDVTYDPNQHESGSWQLMPETR